jgi:dipeptidyl-peptidase-4
MPRLPAFLFVLLAVASPSRGEELTVEIALELGKRVRAEYEKPIAWLDEERYVTLGTLAGEDGKRHVVVHARSGEKSPLFDAAALEEALAGLPFLSSARAREIAKGSDFTFAPCHDALVVTIDGDLVHWRFGAASATRLTRDSAAEEVVAFAAGGEYLAYVKDGNLHVASPSSGEKRLSHDGSSQKLCGKLDWIYQEEIYGRGNFKGWFASPDGRRIAYLVLDQRDVLPYTIVDHRERRPDVEVWPYPKPGDPNPRASLRIVEVGSGKTVEADLGRYADEQPLLVRVHWTPDSSRVLVQVQNRVQTWLDLVSVDPGTGASHVLLREETPAWTEPSDAPFFLKDGKRFLWLSERDGFEHLYLHALDGRLLHAVTSGDFEVDDVHVLTDRGEVYITADLEDVKGAQLFRVDLATNERVQLTRTGGTHAVSVSPQGSLFVSDWSVLNDPGHVALFDRDAQLVRELAKANVEPLARYGIGKAEFVTFRARDGHQLEGFRILPEGFDPTRKYPVFFHTYAGPHAPQVLDRFHHRDVWFWHYLAQQGRIVFVADPRTASGRGLASAAPAWRDLGSSELSDLEDAADWLVNEGSADPAAITLSGWSYGGYITAFALTHSKKFARGVSGAPVVDWRLYDSIYTERYMDLPARNPEGYARSSALAAAANLHGELLLIHGEIDENVHLQNTMQFAAALQAANKPFEMMIYPGNRHAVVNPQQRRHLYETIARFVLR